MIVFVAGASGVIGRPLVAKLIARGHDVVGLARSPESADVLRAMGAKPSIADVFDARAIQEVVTAARPDVVVHQLTALPRRLHPRKLHQFEATNRLRREGGPILAAAAKSVEADFVAQSISFVTRTEGPPLSSEDEPLITPTHAGWAALVGAVRVLEETVLSQAGCALRYGMFYGPGTVYAKDGAMVEDVRARRLPIVGGGTGVFSFVHVEDAADATVLAIERRATGVFNITDDAPASVRDWLPELARVLGAPAPLRVPAWIAAPLLGPYGRYLMLGLRGASNAKAKRELGWQPTRSSWRQAFEAIIAP